ncbi:hypothetical protein RB4378 [Rhodopirellula baltica SH 1]|uniref:Uncharacterized protein n=1 Tax=Rhodopirellula baltica (strain DSM 10527 / NCIMB 13988 / SH1) TaxID=243090 RepID=Q7USP7_RHOBA|nr:hypothetical protein RB4378 [Rhodopirellula baltica SH 1]
MRLLAVLVVGQLEPASVFPTCYLDVAMQLLSLIQLGFKFETGGPLSQDAR